MHHNVFRTFISTNLCDILIGKFVSRPTTLFGGPPPTDPAKLAPLLLHAGAAVPGPPPQLTGAAELTGPA